MTKPMGLRAAAPLALGMFLLACSEDKRTGAYDAAERRVIGAHIGSAILTERPGVSSVLTLIVEMNGDHTYSAKVKYSVPILKMSGTKYLESGSWNADAGRIRIAPKICHETTDVESGRWGQVACDGDNDMAVDISGNSLEIGRSFSEGKIFFTMTGL